MPWPASVPVNTADASPTHGPEQPSGRART